MYIRLSFMHLVINYVYKHISFIRPIWTVNSGLAKYISKTLTDTVRKIFDMFQANNELPIHCFVEVKGLTSYMWWTTPITRFLYLAQWKCTQNKFAMQIWNVLFRTFSFGLNCIIIFFCFVRIDFRSDKPISSPG